MSIAGDAQTPNPGRLTSSDTSTASARTALSESETYQKEQATTLARPFDSEVVFSKIRALLRCNVCLEHETDFFQCSNGHLMCRGCMFQLMKVPPKPARRGTCPTCRVPLVRGLSRCLLATQLINELPSPCEFCQAVLLPRDMDKHLRHQCFMRPTKCRFALFGCTWVGKRSEVSDHVRNCPISKKSIAEVESTFTNKLGSHIKGIAAPGHAWNEAIRIFEENPRGVLVYLRDIYLQQSTGISNKPETFFVGNTHNLSQTGCHPSSIDCKINFLEKKIAYRIKFNPNYQTNMRFRLLSLSSGNMLVRVQDKFHVPKVSQGHELPRYQAILSDENCPNSTCVLRKLAQSVAEYGDNYSIRFVFLLMFETLKSIHVSPDGSQAEESAAVTPRPPNQESEEPVVNQQPSQLPTTMASNVSTFRRQSTWVSDPLGPTVNDDSSTYLVNGDSITLNDEAARETPLTDDETLMSVNLMTNNNALDDPQPKTAKRRPRRRTLPQRARKIDTVTGTAETQAHNPFAQTVYKTLHQVAPYMARGHMWQNLNVLLSIPKRRRRQAVATYFTRDLLRRMRGKYNSQGLGRTLMSHLSTSWSGLKRTGEDLLDRGHSIVESVSRLASNSTAPSVQSERITMGSPWNAIGSDELASPLFDGENIDNQSPSGAASSFRHNPLVAILLDNRGKLGGFDGDVPEESEENK